MSTRITRKCRIVRERDYHYTNEDDASSSGGSYDDSCAYDDEDDGLGRSDTDDSSSSMSSSSSSEIEDDTQEDELSTSSLDAYLEPVRRKLDFDLTKEIDYLLRPADDDSVPEPPLKRKKLNNESVLNK